MIPRLAYIVAGAGILTVVLLIVFAIVRALSGVQRALP